MTADRTHLSIPGAQYYAEPKIVGATEPEGGWLIPYRPAGTSDFIVTNIARRDQIAAAAKLKL